jgi:hypothetical protein
MKMSRIDKMYSKMDDLRSKLYKSIDYLCDELQMIRDIEYKKSGFPLKENEDLERVIERYSNQLKSLGIHEKVIDILVNRTSRCMWALMSKLEKDNAEKFSDTISGLTSLIIEFLSTNIVLKTTWLKDFV